MLKGIDTYFERRKEYGALFIRIIIGLRLVVGTEDNVFSWERMLEFRDFLESYHMPLPLTAAIVSVYAQFICGILYLAGAWTRIAALVMIFNFLVAYFLVHTGQNLQDSFHPLVILFASFFLLFYGAGRVSVDQWRLKKS